LGLVVLERACDLEIALNEVLDFLVALAPDDLVLEWIDPRGLPVVPVERVLEGEQVALLEGVELGGDVGDCTEVGEMFGCLAEGVVLVEFSERRILGDVDEVGEVGLQLCYHLGGQSLDLDDVDVGVIGEVESLEFVHVQLVSATEVFECVIHHFATSYLRTCLDASLRVDEDYLLRSRPRLDVETESCLALVLLQDVFHVLLQIVLPLEDFTYFGSTHVRQLVCEGTFEAVGRETFEFNEVQPPGAFLVL